MPSLSRLLTIGLLLLAAALSGCSGKDDGSPNPALGPPPDIQPGRGSGGGGGPVPPRR